MRKYFKSIDIAFLYSYRVIKSCIFKSRSLNYNPLFDKAMHCCFLFCAIIEVSAEGLGFIVGGKDEDEDEDVVASVETIPDGLLELSIKSALGLDWGELPSTLKVIAFVSRVKLLNVESVLSKFDNELTIVACI